jgi:DNA-binding response OmpR family regulator
MLGGAKKNEREANILLIVYEHLVRDIMARIFTERGHSVVTCAVGLDGIRRFEKRKIQFDLVMSDISLPGISGFGVAKRIKELSQTTPVILIKGWEKELDIERFQECGADLVVCKPLWLDKVLNLVENAVTTIER